MTDAINATLAVLDYDAIAFAGECKKMRDKTVAAHNSATPFARHALTGLMTGETTQAFITASLLDVYKPVSPKGKVGDKLSSLQYADGGDTARKAAEKVYSIDGCHNVEGVTLLVRDFCMAAVGAPKSLNALYSQVSELVAVAAKLAAEEAAKLAAEAGEEAGETSLDAAEEATPDNAAKAAIDAIALVRVYLAGGEVSDDVADMLQGLFQDWQALSAPETVVAKAA